MDYVTLINLIIEVGLPLAQKLVAKVESKAQVTQADFQALLADTQQTAKDRMTAQLNSAGIPLTDPKAVALLALTQ